MPKRSAFDREMSVPGSVTWRLQLRACGGDGVLPLPPNPVFCPILTALASVDPGEQGHSVGFTQALKNRGPTRQRRLLKRTRDPIRAQHFRAIGLLNEFPLGEKSA
jgi:hypothetical protein